MVRTRKATVDRLAAIAGNLDALIGLREAAGKALFEQELRRDELGALVALGAAEIASLAARVDQRATRLQQARAGHRSIRQRREYLLGRASALDAAAESSAALTDAGAQLDRAEATVARLLADSGFDALGDAVEAADIDAPQLTERIRAAEVEAAALRAQLADPDLAGLDGTERIDLAALEAAADADREAGRGGSAARAGPATTGSGRSRRLRGGCVAAWRAADPVRAQEQQVAALTEVMLGRGQNALGMTLRTYVLAHRLAQVADAATDRLARMSAGRYSFVHHTERESRGRAGGLGLEIMDGWSGLVRPAKTLSGGESFLASLALALGLADVVAAEAGGRQLDTLFVDEGFGSLDPDALDLVMATLDELRAGGRVVGVVSHVDELRLRIPQQITGDPDAAEFDPVGGGRDDGRVESGVLSAVAPVRADRAFRRRRGATGRRSAEAGAAARGPAGHPALRWARSTEDPGRWVLVAEFDTAAGFRRAQSPLPVRAALIPWLAAAASSAAFEVIAAADAGRVVGAGGDRRRPRPLIGPGSGVARAGSRLDGC